MQLSDPHPPSKRTPPRAGTSGTSHLRTALGLATASLLGGVAGPAHAEGLTTEGVSLVYLEPDRVQAWETAASVTRTFDADRVLTGKLVVDVLTGASPNGAVPSRSIQTFTRPSGHGSFEVAPGKTPLDDTFRDTRYDGTLSYRMPLGRLTGLTLSGHGSTEHDYLSLGVSGRLTRDFDRRNRTLALGLSVSRDEIDPEGGIPEPLALMRAAGESPNRIGGSDTKSVVDAVIGVTQIIDRETVGRLNYSATYASGYQTDPFKIVSVVGAPGTVEAGEPLAQRFESRPDSRLKQSLYGELRRFLGGPVANVSYRFQWDDWSVTSHTVDLRTRFPVGDRTAITPHLRYYHQSEADLYRAFLIDGDPLPDHVSADPRLAGLDAATFGAEVSHVLPHGNEVTLTAEYYDQFDSRGPPDAFGALDGLDLYPGVSALMFRVGYARAW